MTEQIEKIKKLIATATNPKQKAMYQQLLAKLEAETKIETEPEVESKTDQVQPVKSELVKPKKIDEVQPVESELVKPKKTDEVQPVESEPVKPKKIIAPKVKVEPQPSTEAETPQEPKEPKPKNDSLFQAIGIIKGEVSLGDVSTIKLGDKEYRLFYIPGRRRFAYEALKKEIEATGNTTQRLIVYPKILHFPGRDKPYIIAFQISGFISSVPSKKQHPFNSELKDFEFRLCGLWQFIPVCRTPCISVFRNFTKDRLAWIKEAEASRKVKFMKATHAPLLWKDSPVRPFRFNPKLEKEQQGKTYFVELKARFLPDRDVFGFVELLSEPTEERPNFFKASKKMKAEALREAEAKRREIEEGLDTEPIETVTVVGVSDSPKTLTKPNRQDIADSQQTVTVVEVSDSPKTLTTPDTQDIADSQQTVTVVEVSDSPKTLTTPDTQDIADNQQTVTVVEVSDSPKTLTTPNTQDIADSQQTVTVVEVSDTTKTLTAPDSQDIVDNQQTIVKEDSGSTEELTSGGLETLNPEDLSINQLKSIVREKMSDDDIKKFGRLTSKTTWIEAYRHLN